MACRPDSANARPSSKSESSAYYRRSDSPGASPRKTILNPSELYRLTRWGIFKNMDQLTFEQVFTFKHLMASYKRCRRNVSWKTSVQLFDQNKGLNIIRLYKELHSGRYKPRNFHEFDIYDRGKKRHIKSVTVKDRVVQRCLCDYFLVPLLTPTLIYDNGASLKNKGYHFAINRFEHHLRSYFGTYHAPGYILKCDITKYFESINHEHLGNSLREIIVDDNLYNLVMAIVKLSGDIGLNIGSQVSQILAVYALNDMDHMIKDTFGYKYYGRYQDDFYIFYPNKRVLSNALLNIDLFCSNIGLQLQPKKTKIIKMRNAEFLKIKWTLLSDGSIVKKPVHSSLIRMRRKLKKLHRKYSRGDLELDNIYQSWQSWNAHVLPMNSYRIRTEVRQLFTNLFKEDPYEIYQANKRRQSSRRRKRSNLCRMAAAKRYILSGR